MVDYIDLILYHIHGLYLSFYCAKISRFLIENRVVLIRKLLAFLLGTTM